MRRLAVASLVLLLGSPAAAGPTADVMESVHVVAAGETLWAIASRHGLTVEAIGAANGLKSINDLQTGMRLALPHSGRSRGGTAQPSGRHVVRTGDTAWSIAQTHGITLDTLAGLNRHADPARLVVGQVLTVSGRIPAARRPLQPPVAGVRRPSPSPPAVPRPTVRPSVRPGLTWPSRGVITSRFGFRGRRHHHGIDIAAPVGTAIYAARDGIVTFAGWQSGYGRLVILDHGGGLTTWYGHASQVLARVGQRVSRGQLIARVGASGNVTGPNLHFEVRRNDTPLDPLAFLAGGR